MSPVPEPRFPRIVVVLALLAIALPCTAGGPPTEAALAVPANIPPGSPHHGQAASPDAETLPAGTSADWWSRARAGIEAAEYEVTWKAGTPFPGLDAAYQAPNRANDFRGWFTADGVRLVPRREAEPSWEWGLAFAAWGRDGAPRPSEAGRLTVAGPRVEIDRGGLREWFVNAPPGLEQGFTIDAPPPGAGPLAVDLRVLGTLNAILAEDGSAVGFADADGRRRITYGGLRASDASGAPLRAWFEGSCRAWGCGLRIAVDDAAAAYPVTIDPLASSPSWQVAGTQEGALFGFSVATAGDVNHDGVPETLVGAPLFDAGLVDAGRVFMYQGLNVAPVWFASGDQAGEQFGFSVSTAGDYNGDGFSDFLVGAPYYHNVGVPGSGLVMLYLGRPTYATITECWGICSGDTNGFAGYRVAAAGDLNGDGLSDVAASVPGAGENRGGAWVWFGKETCGWYPDRTVGGTTPYTKLTRSFGSGLGTAGDADGDGDAELAVGDPANAKVRVYYGPTVTPYWTLTGPASFGAAALTAGDVNGDGYSDLAVGAPDSTQVRVFRGSATGYSDTAYDLLQDSPGQSSQFGAVVGTAGDVNGDGYQDLIVAAPEEDRYVPEAGRVYVYHGSASGLGTTYDWIEDGAYGGERFGFAAATAGDLNNDGYSDIVVGVPYYSMSAFEAGRAAMYLGGPGGLSYSPVLSREGGQAGADFGYSVGSAGDVNGDGYADVLVGAVLYDEGETNEGKVFLYHGAAGGPNALSWSATSNQAQARLGFSVAGAGDVNGDGYDDVIVGARGYADPDTDEGAAFVWHGSSSGLGANGTPANADWYAECDQAGSYFGHVVGTAGDVNGDGYSDVIVGAPFYDDGQTDEGAAFVWRGSATGLGARGTPANVHWKAFGDQASARFGWSVAAAGDVNGDGFGDVVIGASYYDAGESNEGKAFAWYGGPKGLGSFGNPGNADWSAEGNQASGSFGYAVAGLGDVNSDLFGDVAVGSHLWDGTVTDGGRVAVYHGSADGLPAEASAQRNATQGGEYFGYSVAGAGDVNADGYADMIVGAPHYNSDGADQGRVYVYYGGASGVGTTAAWSKSGALANELFGQAVAGAGDTNGDGFADIVVGAPGYDNPDTDEGLAQVFLGSEGSARTILPSQFNYLSSSRRVARFGLSDDDTRVRLRGRVYGPLGRAQYGVAWRVGPAGAVWTDGLTTSLSGDTGVPYDDEGVAITVPSGLLHWRFRPAYAIADAPFQHYGRWYAPSWGGRYDGSLRSFQDPDGDGIPAERDNCPDVANATQADADADGSGDACDACTDTDGDGFEDPGYPASTCPSDNCPSVPNPEQEDADRDRDGDACDTCTDTDDDGFGDPGYPANTCADDNCPRTSNPGQEDTERSPDGVGDACDNCVKVSNPDQANADGDALGDACDTCTDTDGDAFGDPGYARNTCPDDNCPSTPNPTQADLDADATGDACDACTDTDGDGFANPEQPASTCPSDNCPATPNPDQLDLDGDAAGDACDACTDTDGDGWANPGYPASTCGTDCRPDDATIWSAPTDVRELRVARLGAGNLTWQAPEIVGAVSCAYDTLSSRKAYDWSYFEAACVESDGSDLAATDPTAPQPGQAFYYLVRVENPCGTNMGARSDGAPRVGRGCP